MLKLSHKYEALSVLRRIVTSILPVLPTTLEALDSRQGFMDPADLNHTPFSTLEHLVNLACAAEFAAPILIPYLLYRLAKRDPSEVMKIIQGIVVPGPGDSSRIIKLSPTLAHALLVGRMQVNQSAREKVFPSLYTLGVQCLGSPYCDNTKMVHIESLEERDGWADPFDLTPLSQQFCDLCLRDIEHERMTGRTKVWNVLPQLFTLPSWDDLETRTFEP